MDFFKLFRTALVNASDNGYLKIVKILVEQEGIDINTKTKVYFNILKFQNNIWRFFKFFQTALMKASENGHLEIGKILGKQEGIDINAKDSVYFSYFGFQNNI